MVRFASKGIEAAVELSGHKSEHYIWRYIQGSEVDMEEALPDLWDGCHQVRNQGPPGAFSRLYGTFQTDARRACGYSPDAE